MPPPPETYFSVHSAPGEFAACQRLAEALLPPHRLRALIAAANGSPLAALQLAGTSAVRDPAVAALTEKQAARLAEAAVAPLPPRFMERAVALGAFVVLRDDPAYPTNLMPLTDAPPMLFGRGALDTDTSHSVAIVGSRRAESYGRQQADRFARAFVEHGVTIISGGAAGIDTAAHRGALSAGGRTIAILGCGIDITYPAENRALFTQIAERGGAIVSEFPMGTKPEPWRFPTRNRIIAGIARVTVVIETPADSGALITARNAGEYGRDVWAVPGPIQAGRSRGCHRLIQDGAGLADCPDDVLSSMGIVIVDAETSPPPAAAPPRTPHPKSVAGGGSARTMAASGLAPTDPSLVLPLSPMPDGLTTEEKGLLEALDTTPRHLEEAGRLAGLSASDASVAATLLEMKSLIRRQPGNLFIRA